MRSLRTIISMLYLEGNANERVQKNVPTSRKRSQKYVQNTAARTHLRARVGRPSWFSQGAVLGPDRVKSPRTHRLQHRREVKRLEE